MTWHVAYTAPRAELELAEEIRSDLGFDAYVPVERLKVMRRGIRITVQRPLFSRYLFIQPTNEWQRVLKINGVIEVLRNGHGPSSVGDKYIQALQKAESVGAFDFTKKTPNMFNIGDKIRVSDGPLSGHDGVITEFVVKLKSASANKRAKILVAFMNRMTEIEVDVAHIEKRPTAHGP